MYTDASETDSSSIHHTVQTWAEMGARAIVIVDRCTPENHDALSHATLRSGSRLSLVTIDNELTTCDENPSIHCIDQAPLAVTEEIIASRARGMDEQSRQRLARFADGYPGLAIGVTEAWDGGRPIIHAPEDHFVDAIINGRRTSEMELVGTTARLLSAFGLILHNGPSSNQLKGIVGINEVLTVPAFRHGVQELIRRGVVQQRGRYVRLHPRPVALRLCERQWRDWSQEEWDKVLSGLEPQELRTLAAHQLAWLGETDVSRKVVKHVCRHGGPVDVTVGNEGAIHAEVLSKLAED